ncbi:MAG: AAA family ATPase [Rudanella sp.]|nr:AAA family ATPase [Rudanella sp.]
MIPKLCIISNQFLERNFILFLDEIEIHLHPSWQRKILPVVQQLFPNAQIFISTHSPFVVGSVDGAWVHRFVKNKEGYSEVVGEPMLSEDSNSYDYILAEVFGVTERFGLETTRDLQEFRQFKNQILRDNGAIDEDRFRELVDKLMSQSREVQSIIGMELRQLSRLTNRSFA